MERAHLKPRAQLFVCTNVRRADDPLKSACGEHGQRVYEQLRSEVLSRGQLSKLWITRAGCLGHCPQRGCSVVLHPANAPFVNVTDADVSTLLALALEPLK